MTGCTGSPAVSSQTEPEMSPTQVALWGPANNNSEAEVRPTTSEVFTGTPNIHSLSVLCQPDHPSVLAHRSNQCTAHPNHPPTLFTFTAISPFPFVCVIVSIKSHMSDSDGCDTTDPLGEKCETCPRSQGTTHSGIHAVTRRPQAGPGVSWLFLKLHVLCRTATEHVARRLHLCM